MSKKFSLLKWLGVVLVVLIAAPLLVPYQPIPGAIAPQSLADDDSQFIVVNGVTLHYKRYGQGEPVFILLHGTLANTYTWHKVIEPLAQLGTVIAYDRPPFGLAARPLPDEWEGESPYSYESQTNLVVGLMDNLGISQAILIGNSMGGSIAMLTAQHYPDRVQGLILVAPAQTGHGVSPAARWLFATPQMRRLGPWILRNQTEKFAQNLLTLSWHNPSQIQETDKNIYLTFFQIENWDRGLWELLVAARPFETILNPETITTPTLIITGDDDRVAGTANNIELSKEILNAQLTIIAECGHVPQEECPDAFMDAVNQWHTQNPEIFLR